MPFPDDVLADEEEVALHLRPHWRIAIRPVFVLLSALAVIILAWVMLPVNDGGHIGFGVVSVIMLYYGIRYGVRPLAVWRFTHYVLTGERLLLQDGVIARERREVPLNRIDNNSLSQTLLDRMFGSGTLVIDSVGDQAVILVSVPAADHVQTTLYELIEQDRLLHPDDDEEEDEEPEVPVQRRSLFGRRNAKTD